MFDWLYPYADKLRFPDEVIETQFRREYLANTMSTTRLALVLGLILYSLFGILDIYAIPFSKDIVWIIRYGIVAPVVIVALVASYNPSFQKYIQAFMCIVVATSGLGIVAMISITTEAEFGNRFYFTGLILISMWGYTLSRLRFGYAVLANLIIMIGYEFASIAVKQLLESETGIVIFTMHNFFFLGANVIGMFGSYYLERYTRRDFLQKYTIRAQRDRADKLLYNVLPKRIAERLKESDETIAEEFNSATVLFADIVNFTPISARFDPHAVVDMLNELFSHFDELVDKYGVEKIQVAGDGYMVAAGVPTPRPDHATVLAQLALDMLDYVKREEFLGGRHPIEIRIGLNSGPLIAGVIGRKKYFYALWGDMVNTASRMESHGESGKIQITRETYELVKDEFACEYIGEITVKGKGKMEAWHLLAKKEKENEERSLSHA
ncbi:MAG TPA: adenylate/guanylate cyclase domain-containing protein [Anaerolineales bacterium]|jgi:class 3 adenylate cyclase|nr:adenylate/guanylate cyclase domain-containing protein [Anaerolineales bacterium]